MPAIRLRYVPYCIMYHQNAELQIKAEVGCQSQYLARPLLSFLHLFDPWCSWLRYIALFLSCDGCVYCKLKDFSYAFLLLG